LTKKNFVEKKDKHNTKIENKNDKIKLKDKNTN
jgi:hypothetical protein